MSSMKEILDQFLSWVLALLPTSPFTSFLDSMETIPYLGWLNWFLPISEMIVIGEAWLVAIGTFYLYSVILRWVKAIT